MYTSQIRKIGGSTMVVLPKAVTASTGLKVGDRVRLRAEDGRIIIRPEAAQISIEELVAALRETGLLNDVIRVLPAELLQRLDIQQTARILSPP